MKLTIAAFLTSLLMGGAACSGARASGPETGTTTAARHATRGDSPWLDDAPALRGTADDTTAAGPGDEADSSADDGDDLGDEGSDDFGDEAGEEGGGEDEETTIDFGEEGLGGDEDWEDEEDQG